MAATKQKITQSTKSAKSTSKVDSKRKSKTTPNIDDGLIGLIESTSKNESIESKSKSTSRKSKTTIEELDMLDANVQQKLRAQTEAAKKGLPKGEIVWVSKFDESGNLYALITSDAHRGSYTLWQVTNGKIKKEKTGASPEGF